MSQPVTAPPSIPEIIQRYLTGASVQDLARESAVSPRTIYNWMMKEKGADYDDMITDMLINRIADADARLELAEDAVQIARARETARFARMDFERRRPLLYGPKQQIQKDTTVRVIYHDPTPLPVVVEPVVIDASLISAQKDE